MRLCVVGAVAVGIVLTVATGASYAAHLTAQTAQSGYGATQVLGEQFIKPQNASSTNWGLWLGVIVAVLILGGSGFYGWRRTHNGTDTV